ncbi:MAG: carboxypeptidase regulatory-like domain-containing protein [Acidobacteriota bacterium]
MQRTRASVYLAVALAGVALGGRAAFADGALTGRVTGGAAAAIDAARVYAYELADLTLRHVVTDSQGEFRFEDLPAGLYKIIAHKTGFAPAVVLLARTSAAATQFVQMQLRSEDEPGAAKAADFWSVREQIPPDVLRDLGVAALPGTISLPTVAPAPTALQTEVLAQRGVGEYLDVGPAQILSGRVGIRGQVGSMRIGLNGDYAQLAPGPALAFPTAEQPGGQASALTLQLESPQDSRVSVTSLNNHLTTLQGGQAVPVDLEHYRVSWARPMGSWDSQFVAQYTNESNFYRKGWVSPLQVPDASQTLRVDGTFGTTIGDGLDLETGFRYRQHSGQFLRRGQVFSQDAPDQSVDLFGRGSAHLRPTVALEYGLYTTLRDGSISLLPRGGLVLELGPQWRASASFSRRFTRTAVDAPQPIPFVPVFFGDTETSEPVEAYAYRVELKRSLANEGSFTVSALDRKLDQSLRLYFSQDFFDHLENLYLVPGDHLPEVQASISRRLGKSLQAKFESSYGEGGGGLVVATNRRTYENEVRFVSTSLDTRIEPTSTGIFVAFRRIEQSLNPFDSGERTATSATQIDTLQLAVTQDLGMLFPVVGEWALQLNVEFSRGDVPTLLAVNSDELHRRILAGLALRF